MRFSMHNDKWVYMIKEIKVEFTESESAIRLNLRLTVYRDQY